MFEEAIACFNMALKVEPNDAIALNSKAISLDNLKRHSEALECYSRALELEPHNAAMLTNKGVCLNNLKSFDQAIECFDKAIRLEPENPVAYYNKVNNRKNIKKILRLKCKNSIKREKFIHFVRMTMKKLSIYLIKP